MCISCYYFECKSNHFAESFAPCKLELEETVSKKRVEFAVNTRKRRNIERGLTDRNYPGSSWKPKGALIAHLHEHKVISKLFFFLPRELCRYRIFFWGRLIASSSIKVHIFWEGYKFLQNLHRRFVICSNGQIYGGDFSKFFGLLRIYEP